MARRIEVELTSTRDDGSWTWRAAGAKQPKGELAGDLLYGGAKVGDVVKVEADFHLDGIEVVEVFPPKEKKERSNLLEMKSRPLRDDELVTTQRVARGRGRDDRGRRGDRPSRGKRGDRNERRGGSSSRPPREDRPQRPKPKRLRPKRQHRDELLASIPEEHRPIVEQVIRDGMPGVRAAIEKQNKEAKESGKPEVESAPIMAIAERNLSAARLAEWRDRADAALADIGELDLRDLRSVVVVGADVARDDESRALAEKLKSSLDERMESDHNQWLSDLRNAVGDGRVVRALRLSSRPVKAGAPLPTELAGELARQAAAALTPDVEQDRWAVVLDALAFSPVRGAVAPTGIPAEPKEPLLDEVRRLSDRLPAIAGLFGIDPATVPKRAKRRRPSRPGGNKDRNKGRGQDAKKSGQDGSKPKPKPDRPKSEQPKTEQAKASEPKASDPKASDPKTDEPKADEPKSDEPKAAEPTAEQQKADESAEPTAEPVETTEVKPEAVAEEAPAEVTADADEPEASEPEAAEPEAASPEVAAGPEATEPEAAPSEVAAEPASTDDSQPDTPDSPADAEPSGDEEE